jgi:hypothetical protein
MLELNLVIKKCICDMMMMMMMMMQGYCLEVSFQLRDEYGRIIITAQILGA